MHSHADADTLIERAEACREGSHAEGLALAAQAARLSGALAYPRGQARALAAQGDFLLRLNREAEAADCLSRGLEMGRAAGDLAVQADCLYRLGEERAFAEQYRHALDLFFQAEPLYEAQGDRLGQAHALNHIGTVYNILDDYGQALHFHLRAFRLRDAAGDKVGVACSLNNIGNAYARSGDLERSVQYHEKCLAASRENGQARLEAMCLGNLSLGLTGLGRLPEALEAGRAALALGLSQGSPEKQCYALLSLGRAHQKGGDHAEAIPCFSEAAAVAREAGSRLNECEAQNALGGALLSAGRVADAHAAFAQAEDTARALGLTLFRSQALAGLSEACERRGDPAAALAHHKGFYALEKALSGEAADKRSKTLLIQLEVERVQKDAEIHRLRSVELAQANAALEEANRTLQEQARELQDQAERLERQATEDGLTGLANRRHLEGWMARRFHEARCGGAPLYVAMADVDHFKRINDRFGHQVGDEVLMSVGLLLRAACRDADLAARYGGEEFVLVLPKTDALQARAVCERVRRGVESHPWRTIHPDLSVTISVGLSGDPAAPSHERLLGLADAQLYGAKRAGRNRVFPAPLPETRILTRGGEG